MTTRALASACLALFALSCAAQKPPVTSQTPTSSPAPVAPRDSAANLMGCVNSTAKQNCFEVAEKVADGAVVRVKSRLVDRLGDCGPERYCQCVAVTLKGVGGAGETAVRCSRPYYNRPARGAGQWVEEKYDFGAPVASIDAVNFDSGAITQ